MPDPEKPFDRLPATNALPATRVVDVTMFWSPTGGGVRRYLLSKNSFFTRTRAWRHTIVAPGAEGAGRIDCGGCPLPFSDGYRLPFRRGAPASLLIGLRPDVIEVGDPYRLAWAALDAGQVLGVPVVAFCHSNPAGLIAKASSGFAGRWARRGAERYLGRLYRRFDRVLAPSRSMLGELSELGVDRAEHQPLGVDCQRFSPRRHDPAFKKSLGLTEDTRVLLYVGRFAPEKNLPALVEAVRALGNSYVLLAVGAGPTPPKGERVMLLPHQADDRQLARIYASADAFVHAGDQETFGLAALEAMASGTPLIVRAAAGLAEFAADGAAAGVADNSPQAWAETITTVFSDDGSIARKLAERARQCAESLDWQRIMATICARYTGLIDERRLNERRCA